MLNGAVAANGPDRTELAFALRGRSLGCGDELVVGEVQLSGVISLTGRREDREVYVLGDVPSGIGARTDGAELEVPVRSSFRPAAEPP